MDRPEEEIFSGKLFGIDIVGETEGLFGFLGGLPESITSFLFGPIFFSIEIFFSIVFILLVIIILALYFRTKKLKQGEDKKYNPEFKKETMKQTGGGRMADAWVAVAAHMETDNEAQWKMAILEADSILDRLLKDLGYPGESLGDRLKLITPNEMKNIENAWTAHKFRNRIAHEAANLKLSRDEVVKILVAYEMVFREFDYI